METYNLRPDMDLDVAADEVIALTAKYGRRDVRVDFLFEVLLFVRDTAGEIPGYREQLRRRFETKIEKVLGIP